MKAPFPRPLCALLALLLSASSFRLPAADPPPSAPPRVVVQPTPPEPGSEEEKLSPSQHLLFALADLQHLLSRREIEWLPFAGRGLQFQWRLVPGPLELAWEQLGADLDWLEELQQDFGLELLDILQPGYAELARLRREIEELDQGVLRLLELIPDIPRDGDAEKLELFRACVVHELESLVATAAAIRAAMLELPPELRRRQFWNLAVADRYLREAAEALAAQAAALRPAARP